MAHFGEIFHATSDALVTNGMHHDLGEIPAPSDHITNAKQHHVSRPNSQDEIRRKKRQRRKLKRNKNKPLSKAEKRLKAVARTVKQAEASDKTREMQIKESAMCAEEMRKKAVYFWKKWKA